MNYYSSLIYIAFFKGRFFDYPGYVNPSPPCNPLHIPC